MSRIRVALFNDRAAAEPLWKHLMQAGVPAEIHNEPWQARLWFKSKHSAGVRIEVPGPLSEISEKILLAWNAQGYLSAGICCPECGFMHVDFPQFTEKSVLTNLAIGFLAGLGLVEKDYYCEHCHWMWPKPGARLPYNREVL